MQRKRDLGRPGRCRYVAIMVQQNLHRPPCLELEGLIDGQGHHALLKEIAQLRSELVADEDGTRRGREVAEGARDHGQEPPEL